MQDAALNWDIVLQIIWHVSLSARAALIAALMRNSYLIKKIKLEWIELTELQFPEILY